MKIGDTVLYDGRHYVKVITKDQDGLIMVRSNDNHIFPVLEDELEQLKESELEKDLLFGAFNND